MVLRDVLRPSNTPAGSDVSSPSRRSLRRRRGQTARREDDAGGMFVVFGRGNAQMSLWFICRPVLTTYPVWPRLVLAVQKNALQSEGLGLASYLAKIKGKNSTHTDVCGNMTYVLASYLAKIKGKESTHTDVCGIMTYVRCLVCRQSNDDMVCMLLTVYARRRNPRRTWMSAHPAVCFHACPCTHEENRDLLGHRRAGLNTMTPCG